ncbi:MAG TPA: TRC40/GET3/ArsA family transport-energizing ATPase [Candidatus Limnocylindrales bacterium]|jgi:arsenite-transporting ATPase|nr:TRC40/GET3/ArsA family transport-energizing ATPase [Candidatus Limnocylindrales bacterium]
MRILLFSGKGGVGKTSLSAATGARLAELGYRTLVMSVDPAHSLADAFDLETGLFDSNTAEPFKIAEKLWIHEVNIQHEIKRNWHRIWSYISSLFRTSGLNEVEAEEMAIFPGMEELSALLYVNEWHKEKRYDVIVLDCAPTGESLRFVSMPTTMKWYMQHVFPIQRGVLRAVRPIANRLAPFELPPDSYFASVKELFDRIEGIDELLENPKTTSVRLVTNPEKMVVRETQRAFVYFSLHGLTVDQVLVNRVLPEQIEDEFFREWRRSQKTFLKEVEAYFAPVPMRCIPLFRHEVLGLPRIRELANIMFAKAEDPAEVTRTERPYSFVKANGRYEVRLRAPFAAKSEVGLFKKGEELVVEVGNMRRHIGLPSSMAGLAPVRARLEEGLLIVELTETK